MSKRRKVKNSVKIAFSVPALLCFITFMTNLSHDLKNGYIEIAEFNQLLNLANGFQSALLAMISFIARR